MSLLLIASFFLLTIPLGLLVEEKLGIFDNWLPRIATSFLLGLLFLVWIFFFIGAVFGFTKVALFLSVLVATLFVLWQYRWQKKKLRSGEFSLLALEVQFSLLLFVILYPLFIMALREIGGSLLTPLGYQQNLVWHWGIENMLLEFASVVPRNPIAYQMKFLSYHYFTFMVVALVRLCGVEALLAYKLVITLLLFSFSVVLSFSCKVLTKSFQAGIYATLMFLFAHSGFINILMLLFGKPIDAHFGAEFKFDTFIDVFYSIRDLIGYQVPFFGAPIQFIFHPQPHYLWGMALACVGYCTIFNLLENEKEGTEFQRIQMLSLILGFMPLIHAHSFVAVTALFGLAMLQRYGLRGSLLLWRAFLPLLIAIPQVLYLMMGFPTDSAPGLSGWIFFSDGWTYMLEMKNIYLAHLVYWIRSPGLAFPVGVLGAIAFYFHRPKLRIVIVGSFLFLVLVNVVKFAPSWTDNNKLFIHASFLFSIFGGVWLASFSKESKGLAVLFCFLSIVGSLGMYAIFCIEPLIFRPSRGLLAQYRNPIGDIFGFSAADFEFARMLRDATEKEDSILIGPFDERSLVYGLAGRIAYAGLFAEESGWVPRYTSAQVGLFYQSGDPSHLQNTDIDYIYLGPYEQQFYKVGPEVFKDYPLVLEHHAQGVAFYLFKFKKKALGEEH